MTIGARIVRFPHGMWAAVAALPMGSSTYVVQEIIDERPLRAEAWRRVAPSLGPVMNRPGVALAGSPMREQAWQAIQAAKRAADTMADREIRQQLLTRLAAKVRHAAQMAEHVMRSRPGVSGISGMDPSSRLHVAVGDLLARVARNDPSAIATVLELPQRTFDQRAVVFLNEIVQHAAASPIGPALAALYSQHGFGSLAAAIQRAAQQRAAGPQR